MAKNEIHEYDIGTNFLLTVKEDNVVVDISTATTLEVRLKPPGDVATKVKTASFDTDGTDGKITYVTVADDLDNVGAWKIQARVVTPLGGWSTDITAFTVHENL